MARERVKAVSSELTVINGMAIELQDGMEEGADSPHVGKPMEHVEREVPLTVAGIEHETLSLLGAKAPRPTVLSYHRYQLHLGGLHEESSPHDYRAYPEIPVYPQRTQHCRTQLIGAHALRQLTVSLYHRSPRAGAAPVECLIKKIQFLHLVFFYN